VFENLLHCWCSQVWVWRSFVPPLRGSTKLGDMGDAVPWVGTHGYGYASPTGFRKVAPWDVVRLGGELQLRRNWATLLALASDGLLYAQAREIVGALIDGQEPERSADSQPQAARRANAVRQCPSYFWQGLHD